MKTSTTSVDDRETGAVDLDGAAAETFLHQLEDFTERTARFADRAKDRAALRRAEGRTLSPAARQGLRSLATAMGAVAGEVSMLLAETAPPNDPEELARIHAQVLEDLGRGQ